MINADFDFNNPLAGALTLKVTDLSKAAANDQHNPAKSSKLELRKTVQNITLGTPATETQNEAKPGDILEYAIHYSNTGTGVISDLKINDVIPEFTLLKGSPSCQMPLPANLSSCSATINGADIEWVFGVNDVLMGGAKGSVSYRVTIE